ncbi:efflux RND transporter permease subunit [Pseudomonas aeruginosa]
MQNKLQLATPLLPQEVQRQGIRVTKAVKNFLMVVGVVSTDGSMTKEDLSNYIVSNIQDPLSRTKGVGDSRCSARSTRCASGSTRPS